MRGHIDPRTQRRRSALVLTLLAAFVAATGCDHEDGATGNERDPGSVHGAPASTIPDPRFDASAKTLDGGLAAAFKALNAGQWSTARDLAGAYVRERGAAARKGQAEYLVGMTYYRQMLYAESVDHFLRALQLEPGFADTYLRAGYALLNVGRLAEARAALDVYARFDPTEASAAFGQGLVEIEDDHAADAERFITRAIDLATKQRASAKDPRAIDADLGRYYARLGDVYLRRDEIARAKDTYARAAGLRGDLPEIWSKLAAACERLGDEAGAEAAREKHDEVARQRASSGTAPR